jgi:hypothetical protein
MSEVFLTVYLEFLIRSQANEDWNQIHGWGSSCTVIADKLHVADENGSMLKLLNVRAE